MNTMKKILLICLCMAAVATTAVLGTLAYLTDSEEVTNTFTVGQVGIKLDETKVDEDGNPIPDADRVQENEYHLLPGMEYTKDPMITVDAKSEESYIRMMMTVHNASGVQAILDKYSLGDFSVLIGGWDDEKWLYEDFTEDTDANTITFEFRYFETVETDEAAMELDPLFTTLKVPGEATGDEMQDLAEGGFRMVINGHAIQAAGFENADAAWSAFDEQVTNP